MFVFVCNSNEVGLNPAECDQAVVGKTVEQGSIISLAVSLSKGRVVKKLSYEHERT